MFGEVKSTTVYTGMCVGVILQVSLCGVFVCACVYAWGCARVCVHVPPPPNVLKRARANVSHIVFVQIRFLLYATV